MTHDSLFAFVDLEDPFMAGEIAEGPDSEKTRREHSARLLN